MTEREGTLGLRESSESGNFVRSEGRITLASRGRTQDSPTFSASAPPVVATLVSSLICNRGIFPPRPRFPCPIRRPLCMVARLAGLGSGRAARTVLEQHLDPLPVLGMIIDAGLPPPSQQQQRLPPFPFWLAHVLELSVHASSENQASGELVASSKERGQARRGQRVWKKNQ